jgi:putative transposase
MDSKELDALNGKLESWIKTNLDSRELHRALVVKWSLSGVSCREIQKRLKVSIGFISNWKNNFITSGIEGLKLAYKGSSGYLNKEQKQEIITWLREKEAVHLEELILHIEEKYGVIYQSQQSYYALLDLAKISWKKSQKKNPKGDPDAIAAKKKEIESFLGKWSEEIKSGKMSIFMLDECHLLWGDICGYIWGKKDSRVEIKMTNERERQTYYGALDYHQKEFLIQAAKKGDSTNTITFLEYLMQQRPTARLGIIWDGASYHRSQEIKEYLEKINEGKTEEEWKITCIRFAPNAPEQNPVEDVWLQGKNFLRKLAYRCKSFAIVKRLFLFFLNRQLFDFPKVQKYQYCS